MPVITSSNAQQELKSIIALAETYNKITGPSTFGTIYYYPDKSTMINLFAESANRYARELTLIVSSRPRTQGTLIYGGKVSYLKYPFERFYGFGPDTPKSAETAFVSRSVSNSADLGYNLTDSLAAIYQFRVNRFKLLPSAIPVVADTQTVFAGNPEVVNSTNFVHRMKLVYDTHADHNFSERGERLSFAYLGSLKSLGSDFTFHGYDLQGKITRSQLEGKYTTVLIGILDQRFGRDIPFYLQSFLGGADTLRAFKERRFTARHRINFDVEERIELARKNICKTDVAFSIDPFFSMGQVFEQFSDVDFSSFRMVGGVGLRAKAKPSVIGRLDLGIGKEGVQAYATIDYPF